MNVRSERSGRWCFDQTVASLWNWISRLVDWAPVLLGLQHIFLLLGDPTLAAGGGLHTIRIRGRSAQKILGVLLRRVRAKGIRRGSHRVFGSTGQPSHLGAQNQTLLVIVVGYFQLGFCARRTPQWDFKPVDMHWRTQWLHIILWWLVWLAAGGRTPTYHMILIAIVLVLL